MAFKFEWILPGDPVESTDQYRKAVSLHHGLGFGARLIDEERGLALYSAAVNGNEERPPGRYLLFIQSEVIVIHAYDQPRQMADGRVATTFRIHSCEVPPKLGDKDMVRQAIAEALEAQGFASELPVAGVEVEFTADP